MTFICAEIFFSSKGKEEESTNRAIETAMFHSIEWGKIFPAYSSLTM